MIKSILITILVNLICFPIFSQENDSKVIIKSYKISKSTSNIEINGIEDSNEWTQYETIQNLYNHDPIDVGMAKNRTEIKMTYNDRMLFIYAKCYDSGNRIIQSLQRDSETAHWDSDSFTIMIDPLNRKQTGFMFGVNAGGAEVDANVSLSGSSTIYGLNWNQKWVSSVKQYDDYWIAEIGIPFNSLQFGKDELEWGINFVRGDKIENYYCTWTQFPVNFAGIDLNYLGKLQWEELPMSKKGNYIVTPYTSIQSLKDDENDVPTKNSFGAGIDAKIGITKSLNVDLTVNPDFSNADIDQEIVNITRFSLSLPEQRDFFLQNGDIFSNFGKSDIKPFFSRKIGLVNGKSIPIVYGARVTGNITNNVRVGLMNIQTKKLDDIDAQNNTIAAFNYKVLKRSQIKGLFINRKETGNDAINDYSRNFGLEFTYISEDGNLDNTFRFHTSATDENLNKNNYFGVSGGYSTRNFRSGWLLDVVGENYLTDLGFVPRLENYNAETNEIIRRGFIKFNPYLLYRFYPENTSSKVMRHGPRTWHYFFFDENAKFNERQNNVAYDIRFRNTSELTIDTSIREVNLLFPISLLGSEFSPLPANSYNFSSYGINYSSDRRKKVTMNSTISHGTFFNGKISKFNVLGNVRFKHWGSIGVSYTYNNIKLAEGYGKANLHLVKLNNNLSFTKKLFFRSAVQYNSQNNNFSVFSKLQWRYSPLSDIYLVFNQNNNPDNFNLKNRSLILKVSYSI